MPEPSPLIHVIDDDDSVRNSLSRLLRSMGFAVETYASAEEFLAAEVSDPSCLIIDVQLPGMDGLALQAALAKAGRTWPIIFITAYEDAPTRASTLAAGAAAYLQKPFDDQALLLALQRLLP